MPPCVRQAHRSVLITNCYRLKQFVIGLDCVSVVQDGPQMEGQMTEHQARQLARAFDDPSEYFAKRIRGQWVVWCKASGHAVEFSQHDLDKVVS